MFGIWGLLGLFIGGLYFLPQEYRLVVLVTGGVGLAVWVGCAIRLETSAIRVHEASEVTLVITGVAAEFLEALDQFRFKAEPLSASSALADNPHRLGQVWLTREEAEESDLPPLGIRCGEPANCWRLRGFGIPSEREIWGHLFGLHVGYLLLVWFREKLMVRAPFCHCHKDHWAARQWLQAALIVLAILVALGLILVRLTPAGLSVGSLIVWVLTLAALIISAGAIHHNTLRPLAVGNWAICLTGVSCRFLIALWEKRQAFSDSDESDAMVRNEALMP